MDSVIIGEKHKYHIDKTVAKAEAGTIYRVFTRRRSGNVIKRRYFAAIVAADNVDNVDFQSAVQRAVNSITYPVHKEDSFTVDGHRCVVIGKGEPQEKGNRSSAIYNKGYLMVILSALILILIIVRSFRKTPEPVLPADPEQEVYEESNVL
ncbi:MAG: hypothetical protein J6Y98_02085 [Bacteroidales bacterium]|nr:hypothetical protein [Bacteroidales bacterium]